MKNFNSPNATLESIYQEVSAFANEGSDLFDDRRFNELALRIFRFQYDNNEPYRKYCQKKGVDPDGIDDWEEICAVPTEAFKQLTLSCFPPKDAAKVFMTGGTTDPQRRGKIYIHPLQLKFIQMANTLICKEYVFPDVDKLKLLMLMPSPEMIPTMYMLYGVKVTIDYLGTPESRFLISQEGFDVQGLIAELRQAESSGEPVGIIGPTSAGFGKFFDYCRNVNLKFKLPPGSRVMDAGGYKTGNFRIITKDEFMEMKSEILDVPDKYAINVLGMTEVVNLFFDNGLRNSLKGITTERYKSNYPWTRTVAVDPETLQRLPKGKTGLLRFYDLMNIGTVMAIQTDDLGYETANGFEIIGRAQGAEKKGCSLVVGEMIAATKGYK